MSILDLFESGHHSRNLGHFAAIVNIASVHGEVKEREQKLLERFARKLDIREEEYSRVIENPTAIPIEPPHGYTERLERIHDIFQVVYSDHEMDNEEANLLKKYAIGIGFSSETAEDIIQRSRRIFSGQISFDDYKYLVEKR